MSVSDMIPPQEMVFVGQGDFLTIGNEFRDLFVDLGGLQPHERVLDVGCGIGRMAVPLTQYLDACGHYDGFDIVRSGIDWCQGKITPRYPQFQFHLADIYNKHYRPDGSTHPARYRFPFADEQFDFTFLTSVFTHLLPDAVENYLFEIARTLRMGGRCFVTFFLMNESAAAAVQAKSADMDFRFEMGECFSVDQAVPEQALCYDETAVRQLFDRCGLAIREPVHHGKWCRRGEHVHWQDIVIATKVRPANRPAAPSWLQRLSLFPRRFRPIGDLRRRYRIPA